MRGMEVARGLEMVSVWADQYNMSGLWCVLAVCDDDEGCVDDVGGRMEIWHAQAGSRSQTASPRPWLTLFPHNLPFHNWKLRIILTGNGNQLIRVSPRIAKSATRVRTKINSLADLSESRGPVFVFR